VTEVSISGLSVAPQPVTWSAAGNHAGLLETGWDWSVIIDLP